MTKTIHRAPYLILEYTQSPDSVMDHYYDDNRRDPDPTLRYDMISNHVLMCLRESVGKRLKVAVNKVRRVRGGYFRISLLGDYDNLIRIIKEFELGQDGTKLNGVPI